MTANPLTVVHLRGRDRLAYQLRALRRLYPHLLAGRHDVAARDLFSDDGLAIRTASDLHQTVSRTDDDDATRLGGPGASAAHFHGAALDPLAAARLHEFHRLSLSLILGISREFVEDLDSPLPFLSPRYVEWSWNAMSDWDATPPNLSTAAREGVLVVHELLLCQLATDLSKQVVTGKKAGKSSRSLPAAREMVLERLQDRVRSLAEQRLDTGEMLSHWLALEGVKLVISSTRAPAGRPLPAPLPEYWQCLAADLHPLVAQFLARNELVLGALDEVRKHVHSVRPVPTREPLTIVPHVQGVLTRLQQFGSRLVIEEKPQDIKKAVFIGDVARSEIEKFAALDSPTLAAAESATLRNSLHSELREAELKLFRTTVAPRPSFYDAFINWASRHVVLTSGVHLPLSAECLDLVLLCHNLLALDQALAEEKQAEKSSSALQQSIKKIRQALESPAKAIAQLDPGIGDMLVLLRALEGLRVSLAQRHAGNAKATWDAVLRRIPQEIAGQVLALAGKSPLVRLTVPALEEALGDDEPWAALERFLDDPRAEPLRDYAAGQLVAQVMADRQLMGTFGRRALQQCLATGTLGGALLVAECFQVLFQRLFVPCDIAAAAFRDPHEAATAGKLKAAAIEFGHWFFDIDQPGPRAVFEALVGLLDLVLEHDQPADEADAPRAALLRHQWRSITRIATRGLFRRPWRHEAQRLLRMFWLNFCLLAYKRFDVLPEALDTGLKQVDDLTSFSCWLAGQTYRTSRTYDQREGRLKSAQVEQGWSNETLAAAAKGESYVTNEFSIIKKRLKDVVEGSPKFRAGLVIRRILVRTSDKHLAWNEERIDELAALTLSDRR